MKGARVKPLRKAPGGQSNVVEIIDETLRDGPQSLWASRVNTETLVSIAPTVAQAGFTQMVVGSGALFEAAVKFLSEDPWERLRLIRAVTPRAPPPSPPPGPHLTPCP